LKNRLPSSEYSDGKTQAGREMESKILMYKCVTKYCWSA